ncbi:MAG TPA: MFS transporter [Nocardioidaceae bacterium]|nr:MFS transporter [Nocardioidaceae bacterium]
MQAQGSARALVVVFVLNGFLMAQVFARVPTLRDQVEASTARLGLALVAVGVGSILAMPWTARLTARFGSPAVVTTSGLLTMASWASLAWMPTPTALTAAFFAVGVTVGVWDVAMNVQGNTQEKRHRRVLMPKLHAGFSAGSVAGALLGAAVAATALPLRVQFGVVSAVAALALLGCVRRLAQDADERPARTDADRPVGRSGGRRLTGLELLLGVLTFSTALGEGAANDWLALVLVDERGAAEAVGALTFAGFNVAMTVGRLGGGAMIRRTGRTRVLRLAGATAVTGVLLVALVPSLAAAVAGGMLWGLGLSVVFPATMSAAGEIPDRGPHAIGVVSTIGYAGFLAGSPTIGIVAGQIGLDLALLIVAAVCSLVFLLAAAARERTETMVGR